MRLSDMQNWWPERCVGHILLIDMCVKLFIFSYFPLCFTELAYVTDTDGQTASVKVL